MPRLISWSMSFPGWKTDALTGHEPFTRSCGIEVVSSRVPNHIDVASAAGAVGLSPDYLGRLCKQQTGVSFSATIRWVRLVTAVGHLIDGFSVTDAAHLAGFADGPHANRVCWEMTGAAPRDFAQAVQSSQSEAPRAG
jgi:methylphosphotriester-DNA--protein-cysteine methyltransferase